MPKILVQLTDGLYAAVRVESGPAHFTLMRAASSAEELVDILKSYGCTDAAIQTALQDLSRSRTATLTAPDSGTHN